MVRHNLETNHNFDFKDFKILVHLHNKNIERVLNQALFLITIQLNKELKCVCFFVGGFQLISLSSQIRAKKLQDCLFEIVLFH